MQTMHSPLDLADLVCFWDFQRRDGSDLTARGPYPYRFEEMNGPIARTGDGVFGPACLRFDLGQWLRIGRADCPALDFTGRQPLSIIAWIQRWTDNEWQYIAGMWDERSAMRQYALFTSGHRQADWRNLTRTLALHQPHGYLSDVGGATPGHPFCFTYATGRSFVPLQRWQALAFTYDLSAIRVYVDGVLDANGPCNPFQFDRPIFAPGADGPDFTVAQRDHPSWPTYPQGRPQRPEGFGGCLGGLAVYARALTPSELASLSPRFT